ncbi:MAG TPA: hypothetical protein VGI03_08890 [Verrucomicrobiae bacterium]|jgi:hypothetical protein
MLPEWTVVGFSGHRKLADPKAVAAGVHQVFERLSANGSPLATISSAASGADTLFLEEVAQRHLPYLIILPFSKDRFEHDFTPADWQRVLPLIEKATHIEEVSGEESKEGAYMETGIVTTDRADVMVVVWDGRPAAGFGGTGDVVNYARKLEKPLIIIDPTTGSICEEGLERLPARSIPTDWKDNPRETVKNNFQELDEAAELHAPKSRHLILRIILFQLAASAVGLTALSFERYVGIKMVNPLSTLVELIFLGVAFISALQHRRKSDEWMKNRIQAEICRSFLAMWGMRQRADHFPKISIQGFNRMCRNLRLIRVLDKEPTPPLESVRDEYLKARVEDQIRFFSVKGEMAQAAYKRLKFYTLASTTVATLCSLLAFVHSMLELPELALLIPKYLSLLLPLASTAFFLLIVTQDYSRRAVRYAEMVSMLQDAKKRLEAVKTWNGLARIATETEAQLLQEVVEWHSFRKFAGEPN